MKKLVIFDLDGTLLNTISDLGAATNHALAEMGYPTHSIASYNFMVGNGITRLIERALPEDARTEPIIRTMRDHFVAYYDKHLCDTTEPYPGILDLLTDLNVRGVAIAVASNKYEAAVKMLIHHFFPQFEWTSVHGHREGIPTKPDPSIVFEVLTDHPTPKAEVLYCGDSGVDMETARRACVESVGVTWGFRPKSELDRAGADHIITSPDDILSLLA